MLALETAIRATLDAAACDCELTLEPTKAGLMLVASQDQHSIGFPLHASDLADARLGRWIGRHVVEAFSRTACRV